MIQQYDIYIDYGYNKGIIALSGSAEELMGFAKVLYSFSSNVEIRLVKTEGEREFGRTFNIIEDLIDCLDTLIDCDKEE